MTRPASPRDLPLFLAARFAASIGIQMQAVAVGWQVYDLTERPLYLGLVGLAQFVPLAGFSLLAGDAADRFDRRLILLGSHVLTTACSLALVFLSLAEAPPPWAFWAVLLVFGASRAFSRPAGQALLPQLVSESRLARAIAANSSLWQIAMIAGPALSGIVYAAGGAASVYGATAVLSALAFGFDAAMRIRLGRMEAGSASWERLLAGVHFVRRERVMLGAISLDLFAVLLGGAVALLPIFARDILKVGPWGLGFLRAAPAAGAALMAVWLARNPIERRVGRKMFVAVAVFGVATIVFGLSKSFPLSLAALVLLGGADMVSVVIRQTLVQLSTPAEMRGRVSAVNVVFIGASNELGEFESGLTAALFGTVPAVVIGGAGTLGVVALWNRMFPELRDADRLSG